MKIEESKRVKFSEATMPWGRLPINSLAMVGYLFDIVPKQIEVTHFQFWFCDRKGTFGVFLRCYCSSVAIFRLLSSFIPEFQFFWANLKRANYFPSRVFFGFFWQLAASVEWSSLWWTSRWGYQFKVWFLHSFCQARFHSLCSQSVLLV